MAERGSHDILVADFNRDGRPDILGANHGGPRQPVELWLNQPLQGSTTGPRSKHYGQRGARLTDEEEQAKAKALTDYYRICFAHPAVEGILMWGFWEGANWIPVSSLYRRDWSATPAAEAYRDLVFKQWWTNWRGQADVQGRCEVRAFFGKHRVTVGGQEKVVRLQRTEPTTRISFKTPLAGDAVLYVRTEIGATNLPVIFPGKDWVQASPESQGMDPTRLRVAMDYLARSLSEHGGAGTVFIVRNGHAIWQGPECDREFQIYSATKSFTSTVLGLLIEDSTVSLNTLAKDVEPALTEQYPGVTLRHFATMTSGYDSAGGSYESDSEGRGDSWNPGPPAAPLFPPGTKFRYWDDAMMQFGNVLTKAAGQPLDQLFKTRIAEPIGMVKWRWVGHDTPTGRVLGWTGGIHTSSRELARFGHLFLNRGHWNGRQLVSTSWVDQATAVQIPPSIPNDTLPRSRGAGVYGFNWWVNGIKPDGQRLWPGAPPRTFYANGLHNNVCIVIPEWNMVIARTNGGRKDGSANTPSNVDEIWSGFFSCLAAAMTP